MFTIMAYNVAENDSVYVDSVIAMNKAEALNLFFSKNGINYATASNIYDGNYDKRIANLPNQVDQWLRQIDDADHALFLEMLSCYTYLTEVQCQLRYVEILSKLQQDLADLQVQQSEILFVTVESSSACKSGGDNVRADLQKRNLTELKKEQIVAAQSNLDTNSLSQYKAVVFLDDIIGSGITLWKEIESFCKRFDIPNSYYPALFYACIAPRRKGIQHIEKNCRKSGLSIRGIFDKTWIVEAAFSTGSPEYLQIEKYENMVGTYMVDPPKTYFMGFGQNKLLISFHYNTPNNTLSTFWREVPDKNSPPFYRDGNQPPKRPTIDALKKRESEMKQGAYEQGCAFWRKEKSNG